jgi:uncharacterized membrane protein
MQTGLIFSLLAAIGWAINTVVVRKISTQTGESFSATIISIFLGVPFFAIVLSISGEWYILANISVRAYLLLAGAGIIQLCGGRLLNYNAIRLIGTNKAGPLVATTPVFVAILSVFFLDELLTVFPTMGILLIVVGAVLISSEKKIAGDTARNSSRRNEVKGIAMAISAAILLGVSSVMVKSALNEIGSPYIGVFIFFVAAAFGMALLLINVGHRKDLSDVTSPSILLPLIGTGILAAGTQLLFYIGMSKSPVSLVSPLLSTNVLFVFLISFLFIRRLELFTVKVFLGIVTIVIGAFFIFQ